MFKNRPLIQILLGRGHERDLNGGNTRSSKSANSPCSCPRKYIIVRRQHENQVLIPFRDRSWRYGDGAFDMTRTFNGRAFRLKEHIDCFYYSLRYLRLDPGMSPQEMIDVDLARKLLIPAIEGDIDLFDPANAEEMFLTSTSLCIAGVRTFNGARIGDGRAPVRSPSA
jgi:branched-subunit amino acid aminotransferase/4-amino-4-deoxychorismate lyase